jgi:diketogulonate reductase-like aldo/keto reductase
MDYSKVKPSIKTRIPLNNGTSIPQLGLGVYLLEANSRSVEIMKVAVKHGYRHIDTAAFYGNEAEVGEAIRESGIARSELYVTTKLWNNDHGYDATIRAFERSMELMGLDYIDLYLIHWPVSGVRRESWRALEMLYAEGRCKAIGVSNYMVHHLEEVLEQCKVVPTVNQIEMHPFIYRYRYEVINLCLENSICVECYSPLTKGVRLHDPDLLRTAKNYGKSTAQVLIRWGLQKGFVTIPKSENLKRIAENADVFDFEIEDADMEKLDQLNENYSCTWDPTDEP